MAPPPVGPAPEGGGAQWPNKWVCGCGGVELDILNIANHYNFECVCDDCHNRIAICKDRETGPYNGYSPTGGVDMCCIWTKDIRIARGREHIAFFRATLARGGAAYAQPFEKGGGPAGKFPLRTQTTSVYAQCCGSYVMYLAEAHPRCAQVSPLGFERACPGVWQRKTLSDGFAPTLTGTGGARKLGIALPPEVQKFVPADFPTPGRPSDGPGGKPDDTDYLGNGVGRIFLNFLCCGGNCQASNGFLEMVCGGLYPLTHCCKCCCPTCCWLALCPQFKSLEPEFDLEACPKGATSIAGKPVEYITDKKYLLPEDGYALPSQQGRD